MFSEIKLEQDTSNILSQVIYDLEDLKNNNAQHTQIEDKWFDQLVELQTLYSNVSSFAHEFDYSSAIQYNGCRSYLKMIDAYSKALATCVECNVKQPLKRKESRKLCRLMGQCFPLIATGRALAKYRLLFKKHYSDTIYSDQEFADDLTHLALEFQESLTYDNSCEYFNYNYFGLWLPEWVRNIDKIMAFHVFISANPMIKTMFRFLSKRMIKKSSTHLALNFKLGVLLRPTKMIFDSPFYAFTAWTIHKINIDTHVSYPKLKIRDNPWIIDGEKNTIHYRQGQREKAINTKVKCVLIQPRSHKSEDLIIFIHGGAFVSMDAEAVAHILRPIVRENNVPVLSVDYSLAPEAKFPIACQEILDVYVSVAGDNSFLRFTPKRIIVAGESAGAYYSIALAISIAEIRSMKQCDTGTLKLPPLPHAIHAVYPITSACITNLMPSHNLIDFILVPSAFLPCLNAYAGPFNEDSSSEKLHAKNAAWHKSREKFCEVAGALNLLADNPLVNPVGYRYFDRLKTVPLYVTAGEFDLLLDDSITIAKRWRGPVTLDIVPESPHGFWSLEMFAPKNFTGGKTIRQRFRESLQRDPSSPSHGHRL